MAVKYLTAMHLKYHSRKFKKKKKNQKPVFWTRLLQHCLPCWAYFLSVMARGPFAWQDLMPGYSRQVAQLGRAGPAAQGQWHTSLSTGTPELSQEKANQLKRVCEEPLLEGFPQPPPGTSLRTTLRITPEAVAGILNFSLVRFLPRSLSHTIRVAW